MSRYVLPCHRPTRTCMICLVFQTRDQLIYGLGILPCYLPKLVSLEDHVTVTLKLFKHFVYLFLVDLGKLEGIEHLNGIFAGEVRSKIAILTVQSFFLLAEAVK